MGYENVGLHVNLLSLGAIIARTSNWQNQQNSGIKCFGLVHALSTLKVS